VTVYFINTLPDKGASFLLNGAAAGFAPAASWDSSKFHYATATLRWPYNNQITVWGQQYAYELDYPLNTGQDLWLLFFSNQLVALDSYGNVKVLQPENDARRKRR